ncbi:MAG TPA: S9 family peptidase, partial [Micromonosporaceae bacterium]|nr:S9 family peptidase [Micromonosporaceae bacterium]
MAKLSDNGDDPYLWLEEVDGAEATAWVRERSAETLAALTSDDAFGERKSDFRAVLDSDDRIPAVTSRGDYLYNFWQDATHPRGLWRRTTLDQYRGSEPEWEVLLDLDALAAQEGENWVWQKVQVLRPGYERCLISLSRGGADAAVVREFDLSRREFVADGFTLPEAKSDVCWIDADHIFVGTDFGPGSLTTSGYPRFVKLWRRGTPLAEAEVVYEGGVNDVLVYGTHDPTPGFARDLVIRYLDRHHSEKFVRTGAGELVPIPVPSDATFEAHREWLLIRPRSPWPVDDVTYPAGSLLVTRFDEFLAGKRNITVLFEPDDHTALHAWNWTRNHLILTLLHDVKTRLEVFTPDDGGWRR